MEYFNRQHPEFTMLDMGRRELYRNGVINLNKKASPWDEVVIAGTAMLTILSASAPFISDRSWVCKCAYSQCLPFDDDLLEALHIVNTRAFPGVGPGDLYVYFPPVLELEDDGVRSIDPEYQKEIDYYIQFYLDFLQVSCYTLQSYHLQDRHLEIQELVFGGLK